jgi:hypothetical protein
MGSDCSGLIAQIKRVSKRTGICLISNGLKSRARFSGFSDLPENKVYSGLNSGTADINKSGLL